jgi:hypothetical protein
MRSVAIREASRPSDGGVTASGGALMVLSVGCGVAAEMECHTRE